MTSSLRGGTSLFPRCRCLWPRSITCAALQKVLYIANQLYALSSRPSRCSSLVHTYFVSLFPSQTTTVCVCVCVYFTATIHQQIRLDDNESWEEETSVGELDEEQQKAEKEKNGEQSVVFQDTLAFLKTME